jgi:hypothetical protein
VAVVVGGLMGNLAPKSCDLLELDLKKSSLPGSTISQQVWVGLYAFIVVVRHGEYPTVEGQDDRERVKFSYSSNY